MKKIYIFTPLLLALVVALSAPCPAGAEAAPSDFARKAAIEALDAVLNDNNCREILLQEAGFESQEDIDKAELGEGFRIFELNTRKILDDDAPYDPKSHVKTQNEWEFLILDAGRAKTLLGIGLHKNKLKGFSIIASQITFGMEGITRLAKALDGLPAAWPASAGYRYRIIIDSENRMFMDKKEIAAHIGLRSIIELSQNGKVLGFIPLTYTTRTPDGSRKEEIVTAGDLLDPNRFLSEIRAGAKQIDELVEKQMKKQGKAAKPDGL